MTMASAARGSCLLFRRIYQGGGGLLGDASALSKGTFSGSAAAASQTSRVLPVPLLSNTNADITGSRYFSSEPPGSTGSTPERKSLLRMHAVSLYQADYDDEKDDVKWEDKVPPEGKQTYLDPTDGRKAEEEEEATWWLYDGTQESRDALEAMRTKEAQKKRWIQNSRPPVRVSEIDERGRAYGRGTRKEAKARVWVQPGEGEIVVNRRDFISYFPRESDREHILGPFVASQTCGKFDVTAMVHGGGLTGQAGAIRLGLARALEKYNPDYRPPMKRHGFMTRDPRMVERKKVGKVKARKGPQW
eukprot:CAMPEP_0201636764 /NCGR_PEP_ID=MMETSP0493-20130528/9605_1 /ASSEMBLY_ACC=CAM_ASM_000838 /TAXON_ID=420259 /ORGANISM="Thalassiosira gravida, Strain GMp14c1" /LENGTH=302 /DNA_ID=CAMNT_0048108977 /DNA_START=13 /DNA_END=918 /DNA_ORIENTATION=-